MSLRGLFLNRGSRKKQVIYLSSSNSSNLSFITLKQWLRKFWLNDLGNFFKTADSRIKLKKQSPNVADLDSKAKMAFLSGFNTNERIHKLEKKFRVWITRLTLSFNKLPSLVTICSNTSCNLIIESTESLAVVYCVLQYNFIPLPRILFSLMSCVSFAPAWWELLKKEPKILPSATNDHQNFL